MPRILCTIQRTDYELPALAEVFQLYASGALGWPDHSWLEGSLVASTAVNPQGRKAGALLFGRVGEGGNNSDQDMHIDRRSIGRS